MEGFGRNGFEPEKVTGWGKLLHSLRGGFTNKPTGQKVFAEYQAEFVDTNFYYRLGGMDPLKAKQHNDILAIQWGSGGSKVVTFDEQAGIAIAQGIPYLTWVILDVASPKSILQQCQEWFADPLVSGHPIRIDVEKPRSTTRCINYTELKIAVEYFQSVSAFKVGVYSNTYILEGIFGTAFPDWMEDTYHWIANYLYKAGTSLMFTTYDEFYADGWGWSLPPSVIRSRLYATQYWRDRIEAWQITPKGNAVFYIANEWIAPGVPGIKSCDLNVSMKEQSRFLADLFYTETAPPSDLEKRMDVAEAAILDLQIRVTALENPEAPPVEKPPVDELQYLDVLVNNTDGSNCSVYLPVGYDNACPGEIPPEKPIPENKIGVFTYGTYFKIYRRGWFSCVDNPDTPEIKTALGDHYLVYGGEFDKALVPTKRVEILE